MTTRQAAAAYLADRRAVGAISRRTHQGFGYILTSFTDVATTDPSKISRRDVLRWLKVTGHLSANSRRQYYNRVHGFTSWLLGRGVIHRDPFADVPPPRVPRAVHRALSDEQVRALFAACVEPREVVIVALGVQAGLRRAELAGLEVGDIDLAQRTLFVRCGKSGHQRLLPLSAEAVQVVARYVAAAGLCRGPLIRSLADPQSGVGPGTVGMVFTRLAYRAGVKVAALDGVGSHASRHSFATSVYLETGDVLAVRDLLGHQSLATTQVYVRGMSVERLRAAVEGRTYLDAA